MFNSAERECVVCCHQFSRSNRIPRVLHCHHTFCIQCLEQMCRHAITMQTIPCPLCRWITCTPPDLTLSDALYIDTEIWSQISEHEQEENEDLPVVLHDAKPQLKSKLPDSRHSGSLSALKKLITFLKGY
ncbi:E3 ubiquitin-protein ligase rnf152-like [Limanda limanda]|uniref:E3 ubiquitin-protein ligase rnf152-like n=1 Tax=Limanda limanda TaxID=27771 RepID=UPI0029C905A0|nr:E3 ubiquitin-protein ligase rnf152-like [Limanda limanda]